MEMYCFCGDSSTYILRDRTYLQSHHLIKSFSKLYRLLLNKIY
uniref:Uncharacterized protein n=1 Tax=Anguilla anguilla TaxID=7936 RepID=A0A0E9S1I7_ANGAN